MFANRASKAQLDFLLADSIAFKKESDGNGKVIVVSDADIVMNQVSESIGPLPMGVNKFTKIQYANKDFFLNCTEYLANKKNILDARAKDYTLRLLDAKKISNKKTLWQIINIAAPVLLVCLFALLYQWRRKKKYTIA